MKASERLDRLENGWSEIHQAIKSITKVTGTFAASIASHDVQIERLIQVAEMQQQRWEQLQREWQAYLTTIHPRQ